MVKSDMHPPIAAGLPALLAAHSNRYPLWQIEDLYKLIHQAAMGSEHAAPEQCTARAWLLNEIGHLGEGPSEPLIDAISPDGAVVRVHLRPFVQSSNAVEELLQAFLRTARDFPGSAGQLDLYAHTAIQLAGERRLPFNAAELADFFGQMRADGYPAVHHSPAFILEYRPAYRVAARRFLPRGLLASG